MDVDGFLVAFQAAIRGYLLRRDLVQSVRSEYRDIFMQVEGDSNNYSISWSGNKNLCYPTISLIQETEFTPLSPPLGNRASPVEVNSIQKSVSEISLQESPTDPLITTMDTVCDSSVTQLELIHNYPSSREELLKLREQLSLELLWVRQAIQSRLQYLQALSQMHS